MPDLLPSSPFSFALLGAGRVGTAVAVLLQEAGHKPVGVWSRNPRSAARAAERLNIPAAQDFSADVFVIGVSTEAISEVVDEFSHLWEPGRIVWHLAGPLGLQPLTAAAAGGATAVALHPVQACPSIDAAVARLPGSAWGVTCTPGAENWCRGVVTHDLHGKAVPVAEQHRQTWHAAAVVTSNGLAALLGAGEAMLGSIGIDAPHEVLYPLARGTLENALEGAGGAATLTGPAVRGEKGVVSEHMSVLRERSDDLVDFYALTTRLVAGVARMSGRIDADDEREILAAVRGGEK